MALSSPEKNVGAALQIHYMKLYLIKFIFLFLAITTLVSCHDEPEDPNAQLNADIQQIDAHLAGLGVTDDVLYDNNTGIRFVIGTYGQNPPARKDQKVTVLYKGTLLSTGAEFASGTMEEKLEDIEPLGLNRAIGAMMEGTTATFYIPSDYGYGKAGTSTVPANSVLVYTLTLQKVEKTSAEQLQFKSDTAAINKFFIDNNISNATKHSSGMWYTVSEVGAGINPTVYSRVSFNYKLRLLNAPTSIVEQGPLTESVFNLIHGLRSGLPLIRNGSKATFYIPSVLGFGNEGSNKIPENSNLIFEIDLTSIAQ